MTSGCLQTFAPGTNREICQAPSIGDSVYGRKHSDQRRVSGTGASGRRIQRIQQWQPWAVKVAGRGPKHLQQNALSVPQVSVGPGPNRANLSGKSGTAPPHHVRTHLDSYSGYRMVTIDSDPNPCVPKMDGEIILEGYLVHPKRGTQYTHGDGVSTIGVLSPPVDQGMRVPWVYSVHTSKNLP